MEILWLFWTPNICSFSIESCNSIMFILNWPLPKTVHFFANLSVAKLAVLSYMEKGRNLFFCLLLKLRWLTSIFFRWRYKSARSRTTDTQWRHKSKISEKLGRCGRQNMLPPYLKIWEWEWISGRAVKAISSLGVRSPWARW